MNFELVGRMAPMQLTVSPQLLSPLADFAHSSKVRCPACITNAPAPHTLLLSLCDIVVGITSALDRTSPTIRQPSYYLVRVTPPTCNGTSIVAGARQVLDVCG